MISGLKRCSLHLFGGFLVEFQTIKDVQGVCFDRARLIQTASKKEPKEFDLNVWTLVS